MAQSEQRESPVSFRPGKLKRVIAQRAQGNFTEGQVAKRDLGRYYLLIGKALGGVRFTRSEAVWLAHACYSMDIEDAMTGDPFVPEHRDPSEYLLQVVRRGVKGFALSEEPLEMEFRVESKVQKMTPLERAAIVDAIDRLPITSEEEVYDSGNWALIGFQFEEEPAREPKG